MGGGGGGLIIGRSFASEIWGGAYFQEGLFSKGLIIRMLLYVIGFMAQKVNVTQT